VARGSSQSTGDDARLWAVAIFVSVLLNGVLIAWISIEAIKSEIARKKAIPKKPPAEQVVKIFPEMLIPETPKETESVPPQLARTAPDQESAEPPTSRRYIGERNTEATSDRAPTADDPALPSQTGREVKPEEMPETTESKYQDGKLEGANKPSPTIPTPPSPLVPPEISQSEAKTVKGDTSTPEATEEKAQTAILEKLLDGPNPVDTPVKPGEVMEDIKPREEKKIRDGQKQGIAEKKAEEKPKPKPKPAPVDDPAFRGNQNKIAIQGNISRTGRSALDVADSPMGRYQAAISRAVEKEWQINCVRRRDFIVPGYLTVRFFVQMDGRVKSVQFVGDIEGGEVQKGFTLQSIRDAPIPAMPPEVKKEMGGDALELLFNFYF
tara:strand:- start:10607 stop:11749 length:1143 start_codon:yes stop_codon:yes gene_type:complete